MDIIYVYIHINTLYFVLNDHLVLQSLLIQPLLMHTFLAYFFISHETNNFTETILYLFKLKVLMFGFSYDLKN